MVLLDRNWRCDLGEIDLVLRDGRVLVVCEVKTRTSTAFGHPLEAVTEAKADRLRDLSVRWVAEHGVRPDGVRIDLVGVLMQPRGRPVREHVPGDRLMWRREGSRSWDVRRARWKTRVSSVPKRSI